MMISLISTALVHTEVAIVVTKRLVILHTKGKENAYEATTDSSGQKFVIEC